MMRSALNTIDAHSESTAMIGDRMDTDIVSGLEAGLETVLVLSGVTRRADAERHPFRPSRIVDSVADLIDELGSAFCCRQPAAADLFIREAPRRRASWPRCRADGVRPFGLSCQSAARRDGPTRCPRRVREACDSPLRARSLLTVRAAISSARPSERPCSFWLFLIFSY